MQFDDGVAGWVAKLIPGVVGSGLALFWIKDTWPRKIGMFVGGAALSYFATESTTAWFGGNAGLAGFLLGLFGMAAVNKVFEMWSALNITGLFLEFARKWMGLPPAPPATPPSDKAQ